MAILINKKVLAQKRPATTSASLLYAPPLNSRAEVQCIWVCNTAGAATTFSIYLDPNGTKATTNEALYYGVTIPANSTVVIAFGDLEAVYLDTSSQLASSLSCQSSTGGALNFTVMGLEVNES